MPISTAIKHKQVTTPAQCWLNVITSQHDYYGYLCIGTNESLSSQESWHLPPLISRGKHSRDWPRRLLRILPAFLLFFSLPPSPTSLTFNQMDYTNRNKVSTGTASSSFQNLAPDALRLIFPRGVVAGAPAYVITEQYLHGINYNRGSASGRGPTGGGKRHCINQKKNKKRQRQKHADLWLLCTRAQFPMVDSR